jgi:hypothetical protein
MIGDIYAGIGSRATPDDVLEVMSRFAALVGSHGYILRSGGADGADSAFEDGAKKVGGKMEVFLPWPKFNDRPSNGEGEWHGTNPNRYYVIGNKDGDDGWAYGTASLEGATSPFHWNNCKQGMKKLCARNMMQILGQNGETPVKGVVCWFNPEKPGGTGWAIRLAQSRGIKIQNLFVPERLAACKIYLERNETR